MKTLNTTSLVMTVGIAGLAIFGLANTELSARLPFELLLGCAVSLGMVSFAFSDYSRRFEPLPLPTNAVLRPQPRRVVRISAHIERVAA